MAPRETVGLRKKNTGVRERGRIRRELLLKAAYDLLCEQPVEEIAFINIANRAEIPEGSAYHFFSNKYDVFTVLCKKLSNKFIQAHQKPYRAGVIKTWEDLAENFVDRGATVYKDNPPARQLFISGKTPPEIKMLDRVNDRDVAAALKEKFEQHFKLPDDLNQKDIFYIFIEIIDLIFSLSVIEHGKITDDMIEEAKKAGKAYLGIYLSDNTEVQKTDKRGGKNG
ncbi:MAG: TetR family transcriptional regulator [Halieaceae bacterium]|nr:TetR family transcriptional regulator [Halieaceae bacterium]